MTRTPKKQATTPDEKILVERVQTGVRLEKRLLKVLKGLAEYHDMTLGDLLEGIVLHAFDGRHPFGDETRERIADLKRIYKLDLDADSSHRLLEAADRQAEVSIKAARGKSSVRSQGRSTKSHEMTRKKSP
jgi:hypothetical protein